VFGPVQAGESGEIELVQGAQHREAGFHHAPFAPVDVPLVELMLQEGQQVLLANP
jgi:hypothetical protein